MHSRASPSRPTAVPAFAALAIAASLAACSSPQRGREPGSNREVGEPLPEHCLVRGRIDERTGADGAAQFARSFMVPGMGHCAGGPATDGFDGLGAMVRWVEQGQPPERFTARGTTAMPGVERPLCSWLQVAGYRAGDVSKAESFECR